MRTVKPDLIRNIYPWQDTQNPTDRRRDRKWMILGHDPLGGITLLVLRGSVTVYTGPPHPFSLILDT